MHETLKFSEAGGGGGGRGNAAGGGARGSSRMINVKFNKLDYIYYTQRILEGHFK